MKRMLLEGPAAEPLLLAEAKAHLRVDGDAEDALIESLIVAARTMLETEIRRVLITQRWRAVFDVWPRAGIILPVQPLISIEVVCAIDPDEAATILDEEDYAIDQVDGTLRLNDRPANVSRFEVDFTAGYGESDADVPEPLRQAMRMILAHWYEHRSAVIAGDNASEAPLGWRGLVASYRRLALC